MSEEELMKLPVGATCSACIWFARCEQLYGATPNKNECDFYPIKFSYSWSYVASLCADLEDAKAKIAAREWPFNNQLSDYSTAAINATLTAQNETIKSLRAELEAEREKTRRIPVGERKPKDLVNVLVFGEKGFIDTDCLYAGKWCTWNGAQITHWMPLPEPPEGTR